MNGLISLDRVDEGAEFNADAHGIWADARYMKENNLKIGDKIAFKYDTLEIEAPILGAIEVPDHVYDIKDESALLPDAA